jgi:hypothetical protein
LWDASAWAISQHQPKRVERVAAGEAEGELIAQVGEGIVEGGAAGGAVCERRWSGLREEGSAMRENCGSSVRGVGSWEVEGAGLGGGTECAGWGRGLRRVGELGERFAGALHGA